MTFFITVVKMLRTHSAQQILTTAMTNIVVDKSADNAVQKEGVVSKEIVVLRRWGSSIQEFGFINGVDNVNWPPYRDSKS